MGAFSGTPTQPATVFDNAVGLRGAPVGALEDGDFAAIRRPGMFPLIYELVANSVQVDDGINAINTANSEGGLFPGRWILTNIGPGSTSSIKGGVLIVRPGAPAAQYVGNVYPDFPTAYAHASDGDTIQFENIYAQAHIPAGNWNLQGIGLIGSDSTLVSPVVVDDGGHLLNFSRAGFGLTLDSHSTTSVITSVGPNDFLVLQDGAGLSGIPAAAPFIHVPAATQQIVLLDTGTGFFPSHILQIDPGGAAMLVLENSTVINPSTITGTGTLQVNIDSLSTNFFAQPGFTGPTTINLNSNSKYAFYNDALVPPPLGVNNVQAAIDALKGMSAAIRYTDLFVTVALQTIFNLSHVPAQPANLIFSLNGQIQTPVLDYTVAGNVLTFLNTSFTISVGWNAIAQYQ